MKHPLDPAGKPIPCDMAGFGPHRFEDKGTVELMNRPPLHGLQRLLTLRVEECARCNVVRLRSESVAEVSVSPPTEGQGYRNLREGLANAMEIADYPPGQEEKAPFALDYTFAARMIGVPSCKGGHE